MLQKIVEEKSCRTHHSDVSSCRKQLEGRCFSLVTCLRTISSSNLMAAILKDGEVLFEQQCALASFFPDSTRTWEWSCCWHSILIQTSRTMQRKGTEGRLCALTSRSERCSLESWGLRGQWLKHPITHHIFIRPWPHISFRFILF